MQMRLLLELKRIIPNIVNNSGQLPKDLGKIWTAFSYMTLFLPPIIIKNKVTQTEKIEF